MLLTHQSQARLPTQYGEFTIHVFSDEDGLEHIALAAGAPKDGCLVRIHSECATGDILGSRRCDCGEQLALSLRHISAEGEGLFIYLRGQEGRGIGLANKIKAYMMQDAGADTVDANLQLGFPVDARNYDAAIAMLKHFALRRIRLLTNNQRKIDALNAADILVTERRALWTTTNPHNAGYLQTKQDRMGHFLRECD